MSDVTGDALQRAIEVMASMADNEPEQMSKDEKREMLIAKMPQEKIDVVSRAREEFISIWNDKVVPARGPKAESLLKYLDGRHCDFFIAPASARSHGSHYGGLVMHSLNVYRCLLDVLDSQIYKTIGLCPSEDSVAIVALLHDICKANFYSIESRNRKRKDGTWEAYPFISYNDSFPYGHGEKSVYMIARFMELSPEETMAIRYHMGFSSCVDDNERRLYTQAAQRYPLCVAVNEADTRAALLLEGFGTSRYKKEHPDHA